MLIPLKEWAAKNGLAPNSARAKAKRGMIPATKIGYDWFIEPDAENVDHRRKGAIVEKRKFTNADRIRAMSDEELAELLYSIQSLEDEVKFCKNKDVCADILDDGKKIPDNMCKECLIEWLQSESEVQDGKL